jgi:hypothetical protein
MDFTKELHSTNVNKGEATVALLGVDLALSFDCFELLIESDSLVTVRIYGKYI